MNVISYDDFLLVEKYMGPQFEILVEKNLNNEIDKKIKFGIVMATHKISDSGAQTGRQKYMNTPALLRDSLGSIKDQKYDNYVVYLVGDAYDGDDEIKPYQKKNLSIIIFQHQVKEVKDLLKNNLDILLAVAPLTRLLIWQRLMV